MISEIHLYIYKFLEMRIYLVGNTVTLFLSLLLPLKDTLPQFCTFLQIMCSSEVPQVLGCPHVEIVLHNFFI